MHVSEAAFQAAGSPGILPVLLISHSGFGCPPAGVRSEDSSLIEIWLTTGCIKEKDIHLLFSNIPFLRSAYLALQAQMKWNGEALKPNTTRSYSSQCKSMTGCVCRDLNKGVPCNREGCWGSFSNVHVRLLWDTYNWCFHSAAALIRCKILCCFETNLAFLLERKSEKKLQMPNGSYLQSLWTLLELGGGWFASESSHFTKPLNWDFIPINFKLCGKKLIFLLRCHPPSSWYQFSEITTWLISSLLPLWCAAGSRLFLLPYLNFFTHTCTLLQCCC